MANVFWMLLISWVIIFLVIMGGTLAALYRK